MQLWIVEARRAICDFSKKTAHCKGGVVFNKHLCVNNSLALLQHVMMDLALLVERVEVGKVGEVELVDHLEEEAASLPKKQRTFSFELYDGTTCHKLRCGRQVKSIHIVTYNFRLT